ncbi:Uncharacterized membrane protein YeiH [Desulfonispora thiosulfatigenes DSM 11270]|uniref:Uncharacterized membrane protein YeiH n=1 Tax=Desulfonispora thiosulfatigenes DSM 11270 TaxID=656914 RepID=A0A1W1VDL9_DESTI|nr:trimeric intracellular cation channel family protein [Desulfonispora thiosulfatigenes]SMB91044.1 Uncharacterized membrane protein YeiH [Desulfonispora thiosulfatigenes DSM 11270]
MLIEVFEIIGTIAFAISGALVGINKELDYLGVVTLAVTTALGGGVVRDVLIGQTPPTAFSSSSFIIMSIVSAIIVFHFHDKLLKFRYPIQLSDALGLGAFTTIGASIAIANDLTSPFVVALLALSTGAGGGIIRDVFVKEIPFVFRKEIYGSASILGSLIYLLSLNLFTENSAMYICFTVTFLVRVASMKYNINLMVAKRESASASVKETL